MKLLPPSLYHPPQITVYYCIGIPEIRRSTDPKSWIATLTKKALTFDSQTSSLSTTITTPFSISLTRKYYLHNIRRQGRHYPHNLSSKTTFYFIERLKKNNQSESSLRITTRLKQIFYYAIIFQTWTFQLNSEIYVFQPRAANKHHQKR